MTQRTPVNQPTVREPVVWPARSRRKSQVPFTKARASALEEPGPGADADDFHGSPGQEKPAVSPSMDIETRAYVTSSRLAQGLPPKVTDPDALTAIQHVLRAPHEPNTIRVEARAATHASRTDNDAVQKSA